MNFPFIYINIPAAPAYGVYISQLIRYSRTCGFYQDFLDRWLLLTMKSLNQGFLLWSHHFERFTVATITWLNAMKYMCHKWLRIYSTCPKHFPVLSSFMTYHRFVTRLVRRIPLVEQELLNLTEHLSSPPVVVGFVLLDLYLYVYVLKIVVCPFVLFLLAIVLSVFLRYMDSDYPFGIIKLFLASVE